MADTYTATVATKTYEFDFTSQVINIDATVDNMLVSNLWTAIKEARASSTGIVYPNLATGSGLDTLGTGIQTFLTVTLLDNWEVNTLKSSGKFEVSGGNLIRDDQADPFLDNANITYIAFLSQAGIATTVETGVSGVIPQDITDFKDAVFNEIMENSETFAEQIRLMRAEAAGKLAVSGNTVTIRNAADSKNRITATTDSNGQRTTVTVDGS